MALISYFKQTSGPGKQFASEVGEQPEGVDVNVHLINNSRKLLNLRIGVELRFVTNQIVQSPVGGAVTEGQRLKIERRVYFDGRSRNPQGTRDLSSSSVMHAAKQARTSAREVVMYLQRQR